MQVEETTPTTPLRPTRAGFVRGLPLTMPIDEVIERGREAGIELQPSDIHAARYYMRQAAAAESASIPQQLMLGGTFVTKREPGRSNGAAAKPASSPGTNALGSASQGGDLWSSESSEDAESATPARRGRSQARGATKKLSTKADEPQATLHDRLQSRLRNATFRETAREATAREAIAKDERSAAGVRAQTNGRSLKSESAPQELEDELRMIALRLGTQRVREVLDAMEALALRG